MKEMEDTMKKEFGIYGVIAAVTYAVTCVAHMRLLKEQSKVTNKKLDVKKWLIKISID